MIGRDFSDSQLQKDIDRLRYDVFEWDFFEYGVIPFIEVKINGIDTMFSPENITTMLISNLKTMAETYLGHNITEVAVTFPTSFNDAQRQATKDAVTNAGLDVLRAVDESRAAALAFEMDHERFRREISSCNECNVIVFHQGDGVYDLSLMEVDDGIFEILGVVGETSLLDGLPNLYSEGPRVQSPILKNDLLDHALNSIDSLLEKAKLSKKDITFLVFTGNPEQLVTVKPHLEVHFDGKESLSKSLWRDEIIPEDEAIVRGVARVAEIVVSEDGTGFECSMLDMPALTTGIETVGDVFSPVIPRNRVIPTRMARNFTTVSDNQTKVVINILDGERGVASKNIKSATIELTGISPKPRYVPVIQVEFEIDRKGILKITAEEIDSGLKASVEAMGLEELGLLQWPKIDDMIFDGNKFFEEDQEFLREAWNNIPSVKNSDFGVIPLEHPVALKSAN